ncbi:adh_short domain-containing protein [Cephalotus follicularis]|uniref:Adh_short domain-containing protein n=1 Tax=Cephalotus follicularis TaxID=3775 RepID=A0A1Q3CPR9_CEPFO|nr:adh_short domain-containing protein [Cephalotus follicularis]
MDWIHKYLNILLTPLILSSFLISLPLRHVFKLVSRIKRYIFSENVAGKVILITGASSGIGEQLAYEYARRGARLALIARREDRLKEVAKKAHRLGSPDVIVLSADVSKVENCQRFIGETLRHFGQLDHLVNNAGITEILMFEDVIKISDFTPIMDINFWGSVYSTHFAVPHLRKSRGKIVVIASSNGWLHMPKLSLYNASKAALIGFYETLRVEFGSDIGIIIVIPGLIDSEMTQLSEMSQVKSELKAQLDFVPRESAEMCAKAIVNGVCHGERYIIEPFWMRLLFLAKLLCPEVVEWCHRWLFITAKPWPGNLKKKCF